MSTSLWQPWSLRELVSELDRGTTTPAEAMARSAARIEETEPELRAWVIRHESAPAAGPLAGVPLGVKDIIDVAGLPTRCGSSLRAEATPADEDAAIVSAWRRAGAVPVGKTVTTEFAFFSPGPTANPAATDRTPGGSSSGSAAAVGAGQVPLGLGSQTAGSVTRPAAYCGVAALVMSHGRFPVDGVTGLSESLDSHGVYAATASDLALAWSALSGEPDVARPGAPDRVEPLRVLLWSAAPLGVLDPAMQGALDTTRAALEASDARVVDFPEEQLVADLAAAHPVVMAYEAARERAAELAAADQLSEPLAGLLRTGAETSRRDYDAARDVIARGRERVAELLGSYDVIVGAAAPGPAPHGLGATGDPVLSRPWQALGLPVVTVPGLRDAEGMPLGIQVIGRSHGEAALLSAACTVEQSLVS
ncbi:amidase [Nocardioides luteus]|uniref:Amidase n=1 Tax=Nocardioides luteus TaxID=1844 RepID=A0A1J4ND07_9ACTN|nr:amidase [Nocardioides luteus]OIJ28496.1 amidase [Nocardioides luteus]